MVIVNRIERVLPNSIPPTNSKITKIMKVKKPKEYRKQEEK